METAALNQEGRKTGRNPQLVINNTEVHPWCKVGRDEVMALDFVETCDPKDADGWGVYVHQVEGGLVHVQDCATEAEADALADHLLADPTCPVCEGTGHDAGHHWPDGSPASCEICEGYGRFNLVPLVYRDPHRNPHSA